MSNTSHIKLLDSSLVPWLAWGNGTGKALHRDIAPQTNRAALTAGFRHVDTAQIYGVREGGPFGGAEQIVGDVVADLPGENERAEIFITSKLGKQRDAEGNQVAITAQNAKEAILNSNARLGRVPDLFLIHNPFVVEEGQLTAVWKVMEDLKDNGQLKAIGVSNFRPQDLQQVLDVCKHKPSVNQIEFHPFVLSHLEPVLKLQQEHGIKLASYGPLVPLLKHHSKGGRLVPVLDKITARLNSERNAGGFEYTNTDVLLLWTKAMGAIVVSASANEERIKHLGALAQSSLELHQDEVKEITEVGKKVYFRHYKEHMTKDFAVPTGLPSE